MEPELMPVALEAWDGVPMLNQYFDGQGAVKFKSGASYEGDWSMGRMHGKGKMVLPDGLVYEGDFKENSINGSGQYTWPSGACYVGEVKDGKRHGLGTMSFADSATMYEGQWVEGLRHGIGTLYLNEARTHFYKGDWQHDCKHGKGLMVYENGDVYDGEWANDLKCGHGVMHWNSLQQHYMGQWAGNTPCGIGTHTWMQLVAEPTAATHAALLMFNRYHGSFKGGKREGYGVLFYATGARYEGMWVADKKQGAGCFVFENGDTWRGSFENDRPVLTEGQVFAPSTAGPVLDLSDLLEEEEGPAGSGRAVDKVLMVYNSELRALYDKYCKRSNMHIATGSPRPSFTLVAAQLWDLLGDCRLITAATSLHAVASMLALARRPPPALREFRQQMQSSLHDPHDPASQSFWQGLDREAVAGGPYHPMTELLFPQFCEVLVRLAAARYRALPGLERRLHTLVNNHLLHLVSKSKSVVAPPRTAFQMEFSSADIQTFLGELDNSLRRMFLVCAEEMPANGGEVPLHPSPSPSPSTSQIANASTCARDASLFLASLGVLPGGAEGQRLLARAMCHNFLQANMYGQSQRLRIEQADDQVPPGTPADAAGATQQQVEVDPAASGQDPDPLDDRELSCWLDAPLLYPDFVEGLARAADLAHRDMPDSLAVKLRLTLLGEQGLLTSFKTLLGELRSPRMRQSSRALQPLTPEEVEEAEATTVVY